MLDGVFIFFLAVGRVSHTASSKMTPSILLSVPPLFTLKKTRNIFSPRSGGHAFQKANATALWERSRTFARSGFFRFKNSDVQNDGNMGKKQYMESHFVRTGMGKPSVRLHLTGRRTSLPIDAERG